MSDYFFNDVAKKQKILVIDPRSANRDQVHDYLQPFCPVVSLAANEEEAIEKMLQEFHTLIFLNPEITDPEEFVFVKQLQDAYPTTLLVAMVDPKNRTLIQNLASIGVKRFLFLPVHEDELIHLLDRCCHRIFDREQMGQWNNAKKVLSMMLEGTFQFRTHEEGYQIATLIALLFPHQGKALEGLLELFNNAIEHGNLGISYAEKSMLLKEGKLQEEMVRRIRNSANKTKKVEVCFRKSKEKIRVVIQNEGQGFEHSKYTYFDDDQVFDAQGRGIALSRMVLFDELNYLGDGSKVEVVSYYSNSQSEYASPELLDPESDPS